MGTSAIAVEKLTPHSFANMLRERKQVQVCGWYGSPGEREIVTVESKGSIISVKTQGPTHCFNNIQDVMEFLSVRV